MNAKQPAAAGFISRGIKCLTASAQAVEGDMDFFW